MLVFWVPTEGYLTRAVETGNSPFRTSLPLSKETREPIIRQSVGRRRGRGRGTQGASRVASLYASRRRHKLRLLSTSHGMRHALRHAEVTSRDSHRIRDPRAASCIFKGERHAMRPCTRKSPDCSTCVVEYVILTCVLTQTYAGRNA